MQLIPSQKQTEPVCSSETQILWCMSSVFNCRYIQYDDWWYPIAGHGYGATVTWDAMSSVFPHGLQLVLFYGGTQYSIKKTDKSHSHTCMSSRICKLIVGRLNVSDICTM